MNIVLPVVATVSLLAPASPARPKQTFDNPITQSKIVGSIKIAKSKCAKSGEFELGGKCVGDSAIKKLASGTVTNIGSCRLQITTKCDLYFTEIVHEKKSANYASTRLITWFLTGEKCAGTEGCLKGNKVGSKYVTDFAVNGAANEWSGEMTLYTWFQKKDRLSKS